MTSTTLLSDLQARGFQLMATDEGVFVKPFKLLTNDDREAIRQHKPDLLILLDPDKARALPITHNLTTADGLLAEVERRGATAWTEDTPAGEELRIGGLTRLPREVLDSLMEADPQIVAAIKQQLRARALSTPARSI